MNTHANSRLWTGLLLTWLVVLAGTLAWGQGTTDMDIDYGAMLRALKPTMTFEVTEENINAYLQSRPAELQIPEGFEEPRVALTHGVFEISARKELVLFSTRVRVGLVPDVVRGRLRLKVSRISAGPIPLPSNFHLGIAQTIEDVVNRILERNEMQLVCAVVEDRLVRVSAKIMPPTPPPAELEAAP